VVGDYMSKDFRVSTGFFTHKKTIRLIRKQGLEGPWYLLKLWAWAREHCPDGNLEDLSLEDIDELIGVPKQDPPFSDVLLEEDTLYLISINGSYSLYNWSKHNSWAAKSAERSEIARKNVQKRWDKKKAEKEEAYESDTAGIPKERKSDTPSPSPSPSPKKKELSSEAYRLTDLLIDKILERLPNYRELQQDKEEKTRYRWAEDIDKAIRLDKRHPEELRKVITWSQGDSFWKANILSGSKLRQQYDKLLAAMNRHNDNSDGDSTFKGALL
jgi:hypothetical protein